MHKGESELSYSVGYVCSDCILISNIFLNIANEHPYIYLIPSHTSSIMLFCFNNEKHLMVGCQRPLCGVVKLMGRVMVHCLFLFDIFLV